MNLGKFKKLAIFCGITLLFTAIAITIFYCRPQSCPVQLKQVGWSPVAFDTDKDVATSSLLYFKVHNLENVTLRFGGAVAGEVKVNGRWQDLEFVLWGLNELGPVGKGTDVGDAMIFLPPDAQALRFQLKYRNPEGWTPLAFGGAWARDLPPNQLSFWAQRATKLVSIKLYHRLWPAAVTAESPWWKKSLVEVDLSPTLKLPLDERFPLAATAPGQVPSRRLPYRTGDGNGPAL